jgi:outer membrane receptor protein involved in Fe transport
LNEFYRGFRVGDAITLPNSLLQSEKATGGELGMDFYFLPKTSYISLTMFSIRLEDAISNVTKSVNSRLWGSGHPRDIFWSLRYFE